ncbi:MAG: DUF1684 domain-containing protein [Candidatus Aminicenantaceae bacterium]
MTKKQIMMMITLLFLFSLQISFIELKAGLAGEEDQSFIKEEMTWRGLRDKQMRSPTSWLTIAGLFWLEEGENSFGSAASNKVVLPSVSAPPHGGKFILKEGKIKVVANEGAGIRAEGKEIKEMLLEGDDQGKPDVLELGELRMWIIKRGERYAIRLRDLNAAAYKKYEKLDFFPPRKEFRVEAEFIPHSSPKTITVETIIGTENEMTSPGYVKFEIGGQEFHLVALGNGGRNKKLFFIFKDETNGKETYGAGRFMVSDLKENGKVDLNFNRAYNPPCAYTSYATCPLAPSQNWLKVRIEAGEKKYPGGYH